MEHVSTMTELGKSENPWNRDDWKKREGRYLEIRIGNSVLNRLIRKELYIVYI